MARDRRFNWRSNPVGSGAAAAVLRIVYCFGRRRRSRHNPRPPATALRQSRGGGGSRPMRVEAHPRKSQCLLLSPSCPPTSLDRFFHLRPALLPAARSGRNLCRCSVAPLLDFVNLEPRYVVLLCRFLILLTILKR